MNRKRYRTLGVLALSANVGLLLSIAIPTLGGMRMSAEFAAAEGALRSVLEQARLSAVNSGRPETMIEIAGSSLRVRAGRDPGAAVIASIDAADFSATLGGTDLPIELDATGHLVGSSTPTVTISNARIRAARTYTVGALGEVTSVEGQPLPLSGSTADAAS